MRVGVSKDGSTLIEAEIVPTPYHFDKGMMQFAKLGRALAHGRPLKAICGGIAGPLNQEKSALAGAPHLPDWIKKPLRDELKKEFGASVYLEHDANLAALAEATYGIGQHSHIMAYVAVGTGIGGSRIVDQKIDQSAYGFEVGHQIIQMDGPPCACGGVGHLEAYVSGSALQARYKKKMLEIKDPKIWDEISKYLAYGLHNIIVHWSPDTIVFGGSIIRSPYFSAKNVHEHLKKILKIFPEVPRIEKGVLGETAGLLGALEFLRANKYI